MKIVVRLHGGLRQRASSQPLEIHVSDGAAVADVVEALSLRSGEVWLATLDGRLVEMDRRLKGIAVRSRPGSNLMQVADPNGVRNVARWMGMNLDMVQRLHDTGTAGGLKSLSDGGGLPTWNFQAGHFAGDDKINGEVMGDTILIKRETCAACAVRCKRVDAPQCLSMKPPLSGPSAITTR